MPLNTLKRNPLRPGWVRIPPVIISGTLFWISGITNLPHKPQVIPMNRLLSTWNKVSTTFITTENIMHSWWGCRSSGVQIILPQLLLPSAGYIVNWLMISNILNLRRLCGTGYSAAIPGGPVWSSDCRITEYTRRIRIPHWLCSRDIKLTAD